MAAGELHAQLYVDYYLDPKFEGIGPRSEQLYIRALCLAKRLMTDGKLTRGQLLTLRLPHLSRSLAILVERKLLIPVETETFSGYEIANYLKRNKSRAEIEEISRRRKDAAQKGNHDRWHAKKRAPGCEYCYRKPDSQIGEISDRKTDSNIDIVIDRDIDSRSDEDKAIKKAARLIAQKRLDNRSDVRNPAAWLDKVSADIEVELRKNKKQIQPHEQMMAREANPCSECINGWYVQDDGVATKCLKCNGIGVAV